MGDLRSSPSPPDPPIHVEVGEEECSAEFRADERLLRIGRPAVRVTVLSNRAVSYGVGVRPGALFLERARASGLALARRTSGGSGVLHEPGDLAWSVVLPRSHPDVGVDYVHAYPRLGAGVVRFLRRHHLDGTWSAPPDVSTDCCVLSGRGQVLTVSDRILGGAAQHVTRTALLHQGMVSSAVDREAVGRLFAIEVPSALVRLAGTRELGVLEAPVRLAAELAGELERSFSVRGR